MLLDLTWLAARHILRRKLRSTLTLVGIIIGITAIVTLLSLGQGLQNALNRQFARIGYDLVLLVPGITGSSQNTGPRPLDLSLLSKLEGVKGASALLKQTLPVQSAKTQGFLTVFGLSDEFVTIAPGLLGGFELEQGKLFQPDSAQVILGDALAKDLDAHLNQTLSIKNKPFTVVGILKRNVGDEETNNALFVSLAKLYEFGDGFPLVSLAVAKANEGIDVTYLAQQVEKKLTDSGIRDFTVQSAKQLSDLVNNILRLVQMALTGIAAIALLVGGIGLANTMYTAVLERIGEIGLLKALGAKRAEILGLFLIESALLGFLGGLLGLLLGFSISQSVTLLAAQAFASLRFSAAATPELALGAPLLSTLLGALAGLGPALRAVRLHPVEALRYE